MNVLASAEAKAIITEVMAFLNCIFDTAFIPLDRRTIFTIYTKDNENKY